MTSKKQLAEVFPNYKSAERRPFEHLDTISGRIIGTNHSLARLRVVDANNKTHKVVNKRKNSLIIPLGAIALSPNPMVFSKIIYAHKIFGYSNSHLREKAVFENIEDKLRKYIPNCLNAQEGFGGQKCSLLLEEFADGRKIKITDLCKIVDIMTDFHAAYYDKTEIIKSMRLNYYSVEDYRRCRSTLRALFKYYYTEDVEIYGPDLTQIIQGFIEHIDEKYAEVSSHQSITHNDLTPRNIIVCGSRICIYDWELACFQNPEHDLIELLVSTIDDTVSDARIRDIVDYYRAKLSEKTNVKLKENTFRKIMRFNVLEYCANRLTILRSYNRHQGNEFIISCAHNSRRLLEIYV